MESRPTMLHSDDALDQQSERQPLLGAANLHADRTRTLGDEDNLISSPASIMSLGHEMSQSVAPRVCAVMFCSFIVGMHTAVIGVRCHYPSTSSSTTGFHVVSASLTVLGPNSTCRFLHLCTLNLLRLTSVSRLSYTTDSLISRYH